MSVAAISLARDVSRCRQIESRAWADGSQTHAAGSCRRRWSSTASAGSNRPRSPRSPSGRDSPSERSSGTSPTSARCCSPARARWKSSSSARSPKAPDGLAPIEAAAAGIEAAGAAIQEGGELPRQRQAIIAASAELQERELIKLASLASALAEALRGRGVAEPAASLTAEAAIAVFRIAFERWIDETDQQDLPRVIRESLDELKAVTAGQ